MLGWWIYLRHPEAAKLTGRVQEDCSASPVAPTFWTAVPAYSHLVLSQAPAGILLGEQTDPGTFENRLSLWRGRSYAAQEDAEPCGARNATPPSKTGWRTKGEDANLLPVAVRTCRVSCRDLRGIEHTVEVTADSVYEAVAQALRVFREDTWVDEIGRRLTAVKVVVIQPEVEHRVLIQDFERWLQSDGKTPAEIT